MKNTDQLGGASRHATYFAEQSPPDEEFNALNSYRAKTFTQPSDPIMPQGHQLPMQSVTKRTISSAQNSPTGHKNSLISTGDKIYAFVYNSAKSAFQRKLEFNEKLLFCEIDSAD